MSWWDLTFEELVAATGLLVSLAYSKYQQAHELVFGHFDMSVISKEGGTGLSPCLIDVLENVYNEGKARVDVDDQNFLEQYYSVKEYLVGEQSEPLDTASDWIKNWVIMEVSTGGQMIYAKRVD